MNTKALPSPLSRFHNTYIQGHFVNYALFKLLIFFSLFTDCAHAQTFDGVRVSIKGGALYSGINDLQTTILSEPFFLNYSLNGEKKIGYTGGLGVNWELKNSIASLNLDILYAQQGSDLLFNNLEKDFNYKMQFNYRYLNFPLMIKVYPFEKVHDGLHGFNVGAGPQFGLNLSPENIIYTSDGPGKLPAFGTDLEQQQQLRNVLKGQNNFGLNFHLGYDFGGAGLNLEFQYHHGLSDIVQTEANAYNFIENKNTNNTFQFTLGWEFLSSYPKKRLLIIRKPRS
ncbi:MAG: outer membrane beta-barrel protein [Haliscomenobacter sp.]|uniref:outer membrane beta-barrel protein n=1 Tax=Haliscomenobacter sp. TaxID=2717303 RepID=UPI0029A32E7B|nr:outer membrane beta-barrel protein [Haliscomenobacter sp.]MDX2069121.1 outer membrane beta-barrel protein [Haliscomenobacter sp.]